MNCKIRRAALPLIPLISLMSLIPSRGLFAVPTILAGARAQETRRRASTVRHTGVITGQVLTLDGKPVRGAAVHLLGPYPGPKPSETIRKRFVTVRANSLGQFRAERLPPGSWLLQCEAEGYFQLHEQEGQGMFGLGTKQIEVTAVVGADSGAGRSAPEPVLLVMRQVAVLRTRVFDSDGRPVTNQKVSLILLGGGHWPDGHENVSVDSQGFFEKEYRIYPNLPDNRFPPFPIEKRDPEFPIVYDAQEMGESFGLSVPGRSGYGPVTTFTLQSGKRTRQDFRLVRGASVSGTVYETDGKTPVAGARVGTDHVYGPFEFDGKVSPPLTWERSVETDAEGHYTKRVDPGVETIMTTAKEIGTGPPGGPLQRKGTKEHAVRLRDGEHRKGIDFILK